MCEAINEILEKNNNSHQVNDITVWSVVQSRLQNEGEGGSVSILHDCSWRLCRTAGGISCLGCVWASFHGHNTPEEAELDIEARRGRGGSVVPLYLSLSGSRTYRRLSQSFREDWVVYRVIP